MGYYNVNLPNYSIGEDCYNEIPQVAKGFGKTAVVIGGKTAMAKTKDALLKAVEGSDVQILDFIWYGGEASYENGDALIANETVQKADILFAVGGGRACDTVKYVATKMDKPLFTFPTVASNCASVTAICVIYHPDGTLNEYFIPKLPDHTFINTAILADSPYDLLWAGIGDALSKECEAVFSSKGKKLSHTPLMGVQLSRVCTEPLLDYGEGALEALKAKQANKDLEQVALDIIISTGLVSNMTTQLPDYYFNSSLAHCVYNASTCTKKGREHLHGEVVSLGVLCLLTYDKQYALRDQIMAFNAKIGLPVCFDDVEIDEDEFDMMGDMATKTTEWKFKADDITREKFIQCMKDQNACGRAFKETHPMYYA